MPPPPAPIPGAPDAPALGHEKGVGQDHYLLVVGLVAVVVMRAGGIRVVVGVIAAAIEACWRWCGRCCSSVSVLFVRWCLVVVVVMVMVLYFR